MEEIEDADIDGIVQKATAEAERVARKRAEELIEKELPPEQRVHRHAGTGATCQYCGKACDPRGLHSHERDCDERPQTVREDDVDDESLEYFLKRPYLLNEIQDGDAYEVIVPSFIDDFRVGKLQGKIEDGRFKVYLLDNDTKTLHGLPPEIEDDPRIENIEWDDAYRVEGHYLYYSADDRSFLEENEDIAQHLSEIGDTQAKIKSGQEYQLIETLLEHGFDPFTADPLDDDDLRKPVVDFELRSYQEDWKNQILEDGHGCMVGPTGSGKSFPAMYLFATVHGTHALVCEGTMTVGQWKTYLKTYTELKPADLTEVDPDDAGDYDVLLVTYHSIDKLHAVIQDDNGVDQFGVLAADEAHRLPADTFAAASTVPAQVRIGLSASPWREDGRTEAIQALTGPYIGADWDTILEEQEKDRHTVNVHIVDDEDAKLDVVDTLIGEIQNRKTLIFSDSLNIGEQIAETHGLTFVSGDTRNKYQTILNAVDEDGMAVVSRVGDHGVSIDGLEAIIEVDFLFGSRQQQIQRTGRLLHGYQGERHDILFTQEEWDRFHKRVFSLLDRGFDLNLPDGVSIPDGYGQNTLGKVQTSERSDLEELVQLHETAMDEAETREKWREMSDMEFLQHDVIKDEINRRIERGTGKKEKMWKALVLIAQSEGGLNMKEIAQRLDVSSSTAQRCTKPFRDDDYGPPILRRENKRNPFELYTEVGAEIVEARRDQEKAEELLEDVLND